MQKSEGIVHTVAYLWEFSQMVNNCLDSVKPISNTEVCGATQVCNLQKDANFCESEPHLIQILFIHMENSYRN